MTSRYWLLDRALLAGLFTLLSLGVHAQSGPLQGWARPEFLLKRAPAFQVVEVLRPRFPDLRITLHPNRNSFYAYGPAAEVIRLQAEVADLDRVTPVLPEVVREFIVLKYANSRAVHAEMAKLVTDVEYEVHERLNGLAILGRPGAVEQAKEILLVLDHPIECHATGRAVATKGARKGRLPPSHFVAIQGVRLGDRRDKVRTLVGAEPSYHLEPVMCLYGIVWAFQRGPAVHFHKWHLESQGAFAVEGNDIEVDGVTYRGSTSEELCSVLGPPTLRRSEDAGLTEDYYEADNLVLRYRHGLLVKAWLNSDLGDRMRDGEVPDRRSATRVYWPSPISERVDPRIGTLLNAEP